MADVNDPRRVIAKRADTLAPAVPYVRGWAQAKRASDALAEQLHAAGLESDFLDLKADVSVFGDGLVCLGPIRPEAAQILADLIATGLAMEMAEGGTFTGEVNPPDAA
ncbi:hypothetical protein ABZ832_24190 [Streptantibioticus parmotrematis]|uniref:hypothetical protein n=1 Tax=Streptantibioticus parmotrematis TaxID=2873249 RepID=UPI0033C9BCA1